MIDGRKDNFKFSEYVESYNSGALAEFDRNNIVGKECDTEEDEEPKQRLNTEFFLTILRPKVLEIIGKRRPEFKVNTLRMLGEHSGRLWSAKAKLSQTFVAVQLGINSKRAKALLEELVELKILQVVKSYTRRTRQSRVYGFATEFKEPLLLLVYTHGKSIISKPFEDKIERIKKCESSIEASTFASGCFEDEDYTSIVEAAVAAFDTGLQQRRFICRTIGHKIFMQTKDRDTAKRAYARVSSAIRRVESCNWAFKLKECA